MMLNMLTWWNLQVSVFGIMNLSFPLDVRLKTEIHLRIYSPQDRIIHTCIKVPWTVVLKSCDFCCIFYSQESEALRNFDTDMIMLYNLWVHPKGWLNHIKSKLGIGLRFFCLDKVGAFPHVGALMIAVTTSHLHALRSQQIFDWVRWERFIMTGCESWRGSKLMQILLVILRFIVHEVWVVDVNDPWSWEMGPNHEEPFDGWSNWLNWGELLLTMYNASHLS